MLSAFVLCVLFAMIFIVMLTVTILNVAMLCVIMLSVVAPLKVLKKFLYFIQTTHPIYSKLPPPPKQLIKCKRNFLSFQLGGIGYKTFYSNNVTQCVSHFHPRLIFEDRELT